MDPFGEEAALAAVVKETRGDTKKKKALHFKSRTVAWLYVVSSAAVFDITVSVHSQEGDVRHKLPHKQAMLVSLGAFSQVYMQSSSVHSSACLKLNRSILTATLPLLGYPRDD